MGNQNDRLCINHFISDEKGWKIFKNEIGLSLKLNDNLTKDYLKRKQAMREKVFKIFQRKAKREGIL